MKADRGILGWLGLAFVLFVTTCACAGTGLSFLEIPVGARESALGGSGVAIWTGPTSAVYNPAAIAFTPRGAVFVHTKHFGDTRAEFMGATVPIRKISISAHYWGTRVSDIEYRTAPSRDPISTFDAVNAATGGAVAWRVSDAVAIGVTGHYLYQKIQYESADGWAVDAGTLCKTPLEGLMLGLAVNHLGHMNEFVSEKPKLPTTLRGGASYEHSLRGFGRLMVTAEGDGVVDNTPMFKGGVEYTAPNYVALRAGYVTGLDSQGFSVGFGLFFRQFHLDYAFIPYREDLGEGHRFSLGLDL